MGARGGLSKSRVIEGLQCSKRLYLRTFSPELADPVTPTQQARFDEGTYVGVLARERFEGGVLVAEDHLQSAQALQRTQDLISQGVNTLYEAAFKHEGVLVRVDILTRDSSEQPWQLVEVKSSTSVKDTHLSDVAVQRWVMRGAGQEVGPCFVMFINNQCVFPDLSNLFSREEVTSEVDQIDSRVPEIVRSLQLTLESQSPPERDIGPHCDDPYECPFKTHCWEGAGVRSPSIFDLPAMGREVWEYYNRGIHSLSDPKLKGLKEKPARAVEAWRTGATWIDRKQIAERMESWKWPLHFLDFETFGPAVPRYPGTRPYQGVPFQFSCHVQTQPGGELVHYEFLYDGIDDPRPWVAQALIAAVGPKGSIVAYNKGVEEGAVEQLAQASPVHAQALARFAGRFVDPWPILKNAVYAPAFRNSYSIKAVAPALLGKDYSYGDLQVGGGQEAQNAYARLISGALSASEKSELRSSMLAYCAQDTRALAGVSEWLLKQIVD